MIDKPNYTQIPNIILDDFIMCMGDAEFKVTMAIARQTFGYHRQTIKLSLSMLQELTGLSRPSVVKGITEGVKRGTIERTEIDDSYTYGLIIKGNTVTASKDSLLVNEIDHEASKDSLPQVVKNIDQDSKESLLELVKNVDQSTPTLKKDIKERTKERTKERPTARSRSDDAHPNTRPILDAYVDALGYKPGNYGQEAKAAKQLAKEGYEPSDVAAAYALLKQDAFWRTKHLSLQTLVKEMPAMRHALLSGIPLQAKESPRGAPPLDRNQAAAQQVRSMLKAHGKEDVLRG